MWRILGKDEFTGTDTELGNPGKAGKVRAACEEKGWIPVSMKDDFRLIYGRGVTRADR